MMKCIKIIKAEQNNLKSVDLNIPLGSFTVICGPSGSGKSSLAFETLYAQGQRLYTGTLSNYARQYIQECPKPLVKHIANIPPALALEQKNSVKSSRPIVATLTQVAHLLRLLFTEAGLIFCPEHHQPLKAFSATTGADQILKFFYQKKGLICVPIYPLKRNLKNFKSQLLREGFQRLWWQGREGEKTFPQIKNLADIRTLPAKKKFYLVVDRVLFKDRKRIIDSLKIAYKVFLKYHPHYSKGKALALSLDKETVYLSQEPVCSHCDYTFKENLQTSFFNFNSAGGACLACKGFGHLLRIDEKKVIPENKKSIAGGAIHPFNMPSAIAYKRSLEQFCDRKKIDIYLPWVNLSSEEKKQIWTGSEDFIGIKGFFDDLEEKKYKMHVRILLSRYKSSFICDQCQGHRFRKEISYVFFQNKTLPQMLAMDVGALKSFFNELPLKKKSCQKTKNIIHKINLILNSLSDIGLDYLPLNRLVKTLSSGEFQRLNLAHQLSLDFSQVLYVLDEPTVGLHSKDTLRLISILKKLTLKKNTLVVVEHDPEVIKNADYIIEMGPESGLKGGEIIFSGCKSSFLKNKHSLTNKYLHQKSMKPTSHSSIDIKNYKYLVEISGCKAHNLKNVCLKVPLNRLVTVTGLSGSGKSTLIRYTLYPALLKALGQKQIKGGCYDNLKGTQYLKDVILMSSGSIEKTKRSTPLTYLKVYDPIRSLMASQYNRFSKSYPISPGFFSLNVEGGRCPGCAGLGYQEVEMVFMDAIRIPCEQCQSKKFKPEVLDIYWRNKNIHEILNMTVEEGSQFFMSLPSIWKVLSLLKKIGLSYLLLGQPLSTLSGGESQRLKLAKEILKGQMKNTLYILDEPTIGLHFREVKLLIKLLKELIEKGASILLIEHNEEVIQSSDYLIDMGPGAGPQGGQIIAQGSPQELGI